MLQGSKTKKRKYDPVLWQHQASDRPRRLAAASLASSPAGFSPAPLLSLISQVRGDGGAADQPEELRPAEGQALFRHRQVRHALAPTQPLACASAACHSTGTRRRTARVVQTTLSGRVWLDGPLPWVLKYEGRWRWPLCRPHRPAGEGRLAAVEEDAQVLW